MRSRFKRSRLLHRVPLSLYFRGRYPPHSHHRIMGSLQPQPGRSGNGYHTAPRFRGRPVLEFTVKYCLRFSLPEKLSNPRLKQDIPGFSCCRLLIDSAAQNQRVPLSDHSSFSTMPAAAPLRHSLFTAPRIKTILVFLVHG